MRWKSNYDVSHIIDTNTGKEYPLHSGTDELWCKILNIIGERPSKYDCTIDKTDEGILIKVWYEKPIKVGYQVEFSNDTDIEDIIRTLLNVPFAFNNAYFKYSEEKLGEIND